MIWSGGSIDVAMAIAKDRLRLLIARAIARVRLCL